MSWSPASDDFAPRRPRPFHHPGGGAQALGPEALEAALVENVQRADLNAIELAEGTSVWRTTSPSPEQVAERVGKDRATVANTVRLLKLPSRSARRWWTGASPPVTPARFSPRRRSTCRRYAKRCCGAACRFGRRSGCAAPGKRKAARSAAPPDLHRKSLEEELSRRGNPVRLHGTMKKGRIEISYFSSEELDRLCEVLFSSR